ncbi:hypothetical protein OIU77_011837 [Salix suchowensis]|nr:hypothetical protein OIU77_011837 [Salix suchowensis]
MNKRVQQNLAVWKQARRSERGLGTLFSRSLTLPVVKLMGSRVPVQHCNLRSAGSFISTNSLHDLNTVDSRPSNIDSISADADHTLNADEDSDAVDCIHDSYSNSLPLHSVGVEEDHTSLENTGSSGGAYDILSIEDVSPIESARARFLQIIVDHFISDHVIKVVDNESEYAVHPGQDKLTKRKSGDVQYEGDPMFALPLMYVANMYETLVNDVNTRLASLNGVRDKTIGVALEAAGGLYRRMAKKFPKKGSCIFKRRELATSIETRTRFPELVIQEEKRVRFVVVNGLGIVEKPSSMPIVDAEWFRRLTGRSEVAVSARDFKFYSPRHKFRRALSNIPGLTTMKTSKSGYYLGSIGRRSSKSIHKSEHRDSFKASCATVVTSTSVSPNKPEPSSRSSPKSACNPIFSKSSMWATFTYAQKLLMPPWVSNHSSTHGLLAAPHRRPCWRALAFNGEVSLLGPLLLFQLMI